MFLMKRGSVIASGEEGSFYSWTLYQDGLLSISAVARDKTESKIFNTWWNYKKDIKEVLIQAGVTNVNGLDFHDCSNLKRFCVEAENTIYTAIDDCLYSKDQRTLIKWTPASDKKVEMPPNVDHIGAYAFHDCTLLENVLIPNSVTSIGECAFASCCSLKSVKIPESVTQIGAGAFEDCKSLEFVHIPEEITEIPYSLFENCEKLKQVDLPSGLKSIGGAAFRRCRNLREIVLPTGIKKIEGHTFEECESLENITIPERVTEIKERAFERCRNLEQIKLPDVLETIGSSAFEGCCRLKQICLPSSVKKIGYHVFGRCKQLTSAKIPKTLFIPQQREVFAGCEKLKLPTVELDDVQQAVEKLNKELEQIAHNYLDACYSGYGLYFEEVAVPDEADIEKKEDNLDAYIGMYVQDAIDTGMELSEKYTAEIPTQISRRIVQLLGSYDTQAYWLSDRGNETYIIDDSFWDHLYGIVCIRGSREHWYTIWYFWSD